MYEKTILRVINYSRVINYLFKRKKRPFVTSAYVKFLLEFHSSYFRKSLTNLPFTLKEKEHMANYDQRRHLDIIVTGKVQGVYFRLTTKAVADQLGVKGIALNQPDGTVYIEAEGDQFALESFLEWCQEGPENAVVENMVSTEGNMKNYRNFEVIKKLRTPSNG